MPEYVFQDRPDLPPLPRGGEMVLIRDEFYWQGTSIQVNWEKLVELGYCTVEDTLEDRVRAWVRDVAYSEDDFVVDVQAVKVLLDKIDPGWREAFTERKD